MGWLVKRKPVHLIVVSYPSALDATLEDIALRLASGAGPKRAVARAQTPADLVFQVRRWHRRNRDVSRLDLIGHGAPGQFSLGDEVIFSEDGLGDEVAHALRPFLHPRARVRLLGCSLAPEPAQRRWVARLGQALGPEIELQVPTRGLFVHDYGPEGLAPRARSSLFTTRR
ncbi:MAG: DUF4347 domain-containing protein [Myxococcota bacterium]